MSCQCNDENGNSILTKNISSNGTVTYRYQCTICWQMDGESVKRSSLGTTNIDKIPLFDHEKRKSYWEKKAKTIQDEFEQKKESDRKKFFEWYNEYLLTPEWKQRRSLVMRRANGICEGCLSENAIHVHHTNYTHVGDELLFDLVALCEACHSKAHWREL